jgi:hypothetical protein
VAVAGITVAVAGSGVTVARAGAEVAVTAPTVVWAMGLAKGSASLAGGVEIKLGSSKNITARATNPHRARLTAHFAATGIRARKPDKDSPSEIKDNKLVATTIVKKKRFPARLGNSSSSTIIARTAKAKKPKNTGKRKGFCFAAVIVAWFWGSLVSVVILFFSVKSG